jgi:hypothetical protein
VQHPLCGRRHAAHDGLDCGEDRRHREREHDGEDEDVAAGVLPGDEELRGVAEEVEQRLGGRERPEDEQVQTRGRDAGAWLSALLGARGGARLAALAEKTAGVDDQA